jgi:hypothetical protein
MNTHPDHSTHSQQKSEKAMSGAPLPSSDETHAQPQVPEAHHPEMEEAPMGAAQQVQMSLSLPHIIRIVIINLLVLTELCVAMYMAAQNPDEFTAVFFKVFFSLLVPTLILGIYSKRLIRPKEQA